MLLTEKEYTKLMKDFNFMLEKVEGQQKDDVIELVRKIELKYWRYVKEVSFFQYLVKLRDLDKVLWLFDIIIKSKEELKKMRPDDRFYSDLQKDVKDWQKELFHYWRNYDPNGSSIDLIYEMKKLRWIILRSGRNLYGNFVDKILNYC